MSPCWADIFIRSPHLLFAVLTSLWTYVLGSCCRSISVSASASVCVPVSTLVYPSLYVPHCLLPLRIRNVTIARFASVTHCNYVCLPVYLSIYLSLNFAHLLSVRGPFASALPCSSEHLVQFYYALHCILLTVLSTSVENWLNINICTHPSIRPSPCPSLSVRFVCRNVCRNIYYNGNNSFASRFIYKCEYK